MRALSRIEKGLAAQGFYSCREEHVMHKVVIGSPMSSSKKFWLN